MHQLFNVSGSLAIAIIGLTIIIRVGLVPLQISAKRTAKNMKKIQNKLQELKDKYKSDPRTMMKEMNKLYKENNVRPFSSLLGLLIQIPIVIGLYFILVDELKLAQGGNSLFFGINITDPNYLLAFITFVTMYMLMKISVVDMVVADNASQVQKDFSKMMRLQMLYFLPIVTFIATLFLPAGLALYFITGNIFLIGQNMLLNKHIN
ncbi:MAG: YidC/Oxa1 family membrane protein insertase [Cyanobium sp. MAG06]|nr:YidC/Oxa1 family membrane protein insertase [Cyanobium sp. MAG06]